MTTPVPPHLSDEERARRERFLAALRNYETVALSLDILGATELGDAERSVVAAFDAALSTEREAGERDKARIDALAALLDVEGGAAFGVFLDGSWKIETDNDDFSGTGLRDVLDRLPAPSTETPHA